MVVLARAPASRDHHAAVDKIAGDLDRSVQEAARVIAQVEDQAVQPAVRAIFEATDSISELGRGGFGECSDAKVADVIALEIRLDRNDVNDGANKR